LIPNAVERRIFAARRRFPLSLDANRRFTVMVGEGRPSTSFFFPDRKETKEKRGCSAFAEHDDLCERV
jgi:hypothetical protein